MSWVQVPQNNFSKYNLVEISQYLQYTYMYKYNVAQINDYLSNFMKLLRQ